MKWPVLILTLCTLIICFSIASESASAQTYGGYGTGFWQSPPTPYYGYYNSGYVGNGYGGGYGGYYDAQQFAIVSSNGYGSTFVFSMNRPAYGNRYRLRDHRQCRNPRCHC